MAPSVVNHAPSHEPLPPPTAETINASMPSMWTLAGKTIAVTGGARGIGITLATGIVESGAHVACLDILEAPAAAEWAALEKTAAASRVTATYHQCDVTAETAVDETIKAIAAAAETQGAPFWGVVACAGVQQMLPALEYPASDFDRIMRINVTGVFNTCKYAAQELRRADRKGSIVIIASMSGVVANRGLYCAAYNSSKAAAQQLTRSLAQEWGQYGIRVNSISPGYIRTAMTDQLLAERPDLHETWMRGALLGRLGVPDDLKLPAVFLLSEGAAFMHGADLRVDGGHCAAA